MKILMLTWEFPPYIAGGLGMACYGLMKAMLESNVQIDMLLPTSEEVAFNLRSPDDANHLPFTYFDKEKQAQSPIKVTDSLKKRLKAVGLSEIPESYLTPGVDFEKAIEWLERLYSDKSVLGHNELKEYIRGDEPIFKKVQEFTARSIKNSPFMSCDIIHAHDWLTYPAGIILKKVLGKPLVCHIHATEFDRAGGPGDERIHKIEYAGLTAADRVIAVSQYTAQMIIDRYCVNPSKIRIVHNAYSLHTDINSKRKLFKDPLVLFLGRITIQKGPDYFLRVAQRVIKKVPKVRFVMAGSGDMFSRIVHGAAAKKLRDRFLSAGFLDRSQVEKILSATDIFVMPSVSEPFGIAPLEAMAFGAVAILSKQSGVAEVVQSAYKVDFWDVERTAEIIIELLQNTKERERMSRAGQQEALSIGWQKAAEKAIDVYRELA